MKQTPSTKITCLANNSQLTSRSGVLFLVANRSLDSREILQILWKQKCHYHFQKNPITLSLSWVGSIQSTPHPVSWRTILILSSHLRRNLPNILFPSGVFNRNQRTSEYKHLLTYSMEQSPSWEANWFFRESRNSPHFWKPKVHHRIHKCLPPVPILRQLHPVPITPSHFLKIHLNIILPSMSGSPQWSLSFRFPHQNPVHTSPLPSLNIII